MLHANHLLGYNKQCGYPPEVLLFTLCLLYQVRPQLTTEEDFGKKSQLKHFKMISKYGQKITPT